MIGGESGHALIVARCLSCLPNVQLHVLSNSAWSALRFSCRRNTYFSVSVTHDQDRFLYDVIQAIKKKRVDIVLPVDDSAIRFVSEFANELKMYTSIAPVPSLCAFEIATDKWLLSEFMRKNGIHGPHTILYTGDIAFEHGVHQLAYPVLTKPRRGDGGKGIYRFDNERDLRRFFQNSANSIKLQYVVQEYVHGYDIDCSILCVEGEIIAYTVQKGFIKRSGFAAPSGIQFLIQNQVVELVNRLTSRIKWSGIAHIDLRYDKQEKQMKVIELNSRYWGSLTGSLIAGVNFPYLSCLSGLHIPFPKPYYRLCRFIDYTEAARLISKRILGKDSINFHIRESDIPYLLADPIAEAINIVRRWLGKKRIESKFYPNSQYAETRANGCRNDVLLP